MNKLPKVADVNCIPLRFQPGDRILVRVNDVLTKEEYGRLEKTIRKWAGDHVEVLIVQLPLMDLEITRGEERIA